MASSICKALDELPTTLDDTYERALQEIPKEKWQHAHRLFQCLVAAIRPLRVDELAEIFAIRFDADGSFGLMEGWRPENPEEAVLSACSSLIAIVENEGLKIVQFSHFSVKEFLTSDRLQTSEVGNVCDYHIPLYAAHTILARACLTVLLQLDENLDKERLETFPLAFYAAEHWIYHARFEDVALRVQDHIELLFNPHNPYLAAWDRIYDVDRGYIRGFLAQHLSPPLAQNGTALYYASLCGFSGLANYIICTHGEDVDAESGYYGTPLRAASSRGHIDVVRVLLDQGANVNTIDKRKTPLYSAYRSQQLEIMRLLLEHGADADVWNDSNEFILHSASRLEDAEVVHLLLRHNADVNSRGFLDWTPLQSATSSGHMKVIQLLLDHGADVNALSRGFNPPVPPLHIAISERSLEVVQLLLKHGADVNIQDGRSQTAYWFAKFGGQTEIAQLLLEYGAEKE
jgi:ankyrin repeat protein